jgi:hypothetical protein
LVYEERPSVRPMTGSTKQRSWRHIDLLVRDSIELGSLSATHLGGPRARLCTPLRRMQRTRCSVNRISQPVRNAGVVAGLLEPAATMCTAAFRRRDRPGSQRRFRWVDMPPRGTGGSLETVALRMSGGCGTPCNQPVARTGGSAGRKVLAASGRHADHDLLESDLPGVRRHCPAGTERLVGPEVPTSPAGVTPTR